MSGSYWYPKFTSSGQHILSGSGTLFLDGHQLHERGGVLRGWQPVPLGVPKEPDRYFAYNAGPVLGLRLFDLWAMESSVLDSRELIELAAGGGVIAGRHAPGNVLVVLRRQPDSTWRKSEIAKAGQPAVAADGELIYRTGDDKIEPSICLAAEAWGDGRGKIFAKLRGHTQADNVTVGPREARVVLVDTPQGPWAVTMTPTSLNIRPLFGVLGYRPPADKTGNNRNLHAHAIYRADKDELWVIWQDTAGNRFEHRFALSAIRVDLRESPPVVVPPPPPPPPDDEPKEPSMPDSLFSTVVAVRAKYPQPSQADLGKILNEIAWLHRDQGWGLSFKPAGNSTTQPTTGKKIAVDILHHKPTDTIWDCFRDAGGATEPAWGEAEPHGDPKRVWVAPVAPEGVQEPPPPPPPPPDDDDLGVIREDVMALRDQFERFRIEQGSRNQQTQQALEELQTKPIPVPLKGKFKGTTQPAGQSFLRHSHDVEGEVTLE